MVCGEIEEGEERRGDWIGKSGERRGDWIGERGLKRREGREVANGSIEKAGEGI